jgi:3-hydroxyacyl-CoA dehydrogenase
MTRFLVRKVAVLGAGVMGAQIAAHLVNVKVPVLLFDLPAELIVAANYEQHLDALAECDLVIEAIAERMDWKQALYRKIAGHIAPHAIVASNTSGLSISTLSESLPAELRPRFCGIHFFNPPRYMRLVELIATPATEAAILDQLETFATTTLGKGVVRAKDTPNFIANRVGTAGMLATIHEAERFGLSYDVVDDLTGKKLGRASSGTFRTADVVGLDTLAHVIKTLQTTLSAETDPFYASFATPPALLQLLELGHLGQKSKAGFYKKVGRDILRFDAASAEYVAGGAKADEVYARMLKKPAGERLRLLRESKGAQGQFLWAVLRNGFHYAAVHLEAIAPTARDVDLAMRWGFGMKQGPFELWQEAGWQQVAEWIREDIAAGKTLSDAPLPDWVFEGPVAQAGGVHTAEGSWNPAARRFEPRQLLPVHARQRFPERVLGEPGDDPLTAGTTLSENEALRLWTLDGEVLIASLKTKLRVISPDVVEGLVDAVACAERDFQGLVIWSPGEAFSAGADLQAMLPAFVVAGASAIDGAEAEMQQMMLRLRYAQVPVVAAMRGLALGGGCEMAVHSARRVAALETYVGLVEVGVGLVPGAGGLTYIARRAAEQAEASTDKDLLKFLSEPFKAAAMATVGSSALESRRLGYLLDSDIIVPHADEVLTVAIAEAKALAASGWRAPAERKFAVAGRSGIATIKGSLVNMRDGGFISAHDCHIASLIAHVVCGGEVEAGSRVSEGYVMALERQAFTALVQHPKTQERIMGMLSTGKPLRN